jgi:ssDNA-binding Zn-finger/Zn-ribbon topoisomerase 1
MNKVDPMEQYTTGKKHHVIEQFDGVLYKHLERLIGSKHGIGKLALNPVSISLITLLVERENEIENFPSDEIDRYTFETLIKDVEEMGFDAAQDMNVFIEDMIQKDYIHVDNDRFIPQKPTISMARLMDLVFPKMPGMSLVAYFVQTMDEVKSNRKDIDSATSQFDQILHMHGIPLEKDPQEYEPAKTSIQFADNRTPIHTLDKSPQSKDKESPNKEFKSPAILGRKSSDNLFDHSKSSSNEPKVLSPDAFKGKIQITKLNFGESGLNEAEPDKTPPDEHEHIETEKLEAGTKFIETLSQDDDEPQISDTKMMTSSEEPAKTLFDDQIQSFDAATTNIPAQDSISLVKDTSHDNTDDFSKIASSQKKREIAKKTVEDDPEARYKKDDFSINDDDIEKRITAFEEDLAMECPICRQSKVLVRSTATGKPYYKCSNKECSFISWGKPHHILCPKCNNPFLIETSNSAGTTNLKCPRATCRYWEKLHPDIPVNRKEPMDSATQKANKVASVSQKPRRRVVRRRVVRKKK